MVKLSLGGIGAGYLYLTRGQSFNVNVEFDYKGKPQVLTFGLSMRHDTFSTDPWHIVGKPTGSVEGATDWKSLTTVMSYTVPSEVVNGDQNIRMRITTGDGIEEYSDILVNCIYIS